MAKIMKKAQSGSSAAKKQVSIPKQFEAKGPQKDVVNAFKNKSSNEPSNKRSNPFGNVGDMSKTRTMRLLSKYAPNEMQKNGGKMKKKAKNGTSFGMLSVKAGVDKNPNPTAADRIAGAKKKAKFGKKMQYGGEAASMVPTMKKGGKAMYGKSMMSKGGKMKMGGKCKNGC
jgi:hypothetical protein